MKKKFDNISLSRRTVTRRIGEMSNDIKQTLNEKIKDFQWYSLAVDESKDITDSAQLCIFIRGIDKNFNITEELLSLSKLQTTTTGNDIFIVIKEAMKEYNLKYHNMSGISTDGAKSMVGKNIGAMAYFKNDMGESEYKDKLNFHCLIHQQNLCSKIVSINDVMTIVVKCINEIKSKSSLRHREFLTFLDDMESAYGDLIYYCDVRWLSRGAMLKRFYELREEVKLFMEIKEKPVPELSNKEWLCDLSFLVDITTHLNDLNTKLQAENQIVTEMYGHICAFKNKLKLLQHQFNCNNFINFPTFQLNYKTSYEKQKYINILFALHQEFEERFMDFSSKECYFDVFSIPFLLTDVTKIPENFQLELIELQERKDLKMKFIELSKIEFYKNLDAHIFPKLINDAKQLISLFGSTYKCEQFFSKMTFLKSKYRSRITDENLESSLVVATTKIEPDISTLSTNKQWQVSH